MLLISYQELNFMANDDGTMLRLSTPQHEREEYAIMGQIVFNTLGCDYEQNFVVIIDTDDNDIASRAMERRLQLWTKYRTE